MPGQTIFDVKRLIGRRYAEPSLLEDIKHWPFEVIEADGDPESESSIKASKRSLYIFSNNSSPAYEQQV